MLFPALFLTFVFQCNFLIGLPPKTCFEQSQIHPSNVYTILPFTFIYPSIKPASTPLPLPSLKPIITPKPLPSITPTLQPKPTPPLSITSTPIPTVTPSSIPSPTPTTTTAPTPSTSDDRTSYFITEVVNEVTNLFIDQINNYRRSQGLSSVQTDSYTCSFAKIRAQEITSGFNHDGFTNRINSKTLPYPSYSSVTENIAQNNNYQEVVNTWINSSGHAANMRADTPYVCVQSSGNFYAYEGWKK